jgi:tRNA (cmo5U34)-methyltransferase
MATDNLFLQPTGVFEFNAQVAHVFNDMIHRSVPYYSTILSQMAQLSQEVALANPDTTIYDLGCSLGTWVQVLKQYLEWFNYVGMDASVDMLEKARAYESPTIKFIQKDLNALPPLPNAGVIACNLVLQFLPIATRTQLIPLFYQSLQSGGRLIIVEKIQPPKELSNAYTEWYYHYKINQGYSMDEVKNKQKALQNVLVSLPLDDYIAMLKKAGFSRIDVFFKWYNFAGVVAQK